tara:strand:+ start:80 stop:577 length:498 start_codon:yes stop_codon:yes gene_type:complete
MIAQQKKNSENPNRFWLFISKGALGFFLIVEFFSNVNASTTINKKNIGPSYHSSSEKGYLSGVNNTNNSNLGDLFEDAYFMYSRPLEKSTGLGSRIGEFLSISIGGREKSKFMGIGIKSDTIKWESIAIENLYRKTVLPHRNQLKYNNPDINSIYCTSILSDECI